MYQEASVGLYHGCPFYALLFPAVRVGTARCHMRRGLPLQILSARGLRGRVSLQPAEKGKREAAILGPLPVFYLLMRRERHVFLRI